MCWFRKKKDYPLDIDSQDEFLFNQKLVEEINLLREKPIKLISNKLITYLANEHDVKNHKNKEIRRQLIVDNTRFNYVGENVASGYDSPKKIVHAWKHSTTHNKIMRGNYTHLVIGKNERILTALFLRK